MNDILFRLFLCCLRSQGQGVITTRPISLWPLPGHGFQPCGVWPHLAQYLNEH